MITADMLRTTWTILTLKDENDECQFHFEGQVYEVSNLVTPLFLVKLVVPESLLKSMGFMEVYETLKKTLVETLAEWNERHKNDSRPYPESGGEIRSAPMEGGSGVFSSRR